MYFHGIGLRAIGRVKGISIHNSKFSVRPSTKNLQKKLSLKGNT